MEEAEGLPPPSFATSENYNWAGRNKNKKMEVLYEDEMKFLLSTMVHRP
jgi:hypothetical protein